eukprot:889516-Pleurochrysis_carterae.AAC.1
MESWFASVKSEAASDRKMREQAGWRAATPCGDAPCAPRARGGRQCLRDVPLAFLMHRALSHFAWHTDALCARAAPQASFRLETLQQRVERQQVRLTALHTRARLKSPHMAACRGERSHT